MEPLPNLPFRTWVLSLEEFLYFSEYVKETYSPDAGRILQPFFREYDLNIDIFKKYIKAGFEDPVIRIWNEGFCCVFPTRNESQLSIEGLVVDHIADDNNDDVSTEPNWYQYQGFKMLDEHIKSKICSTVS